MTSTLAIFGPETAKNSPRNLDHVGRSAEAEIDCNPLVEDGACAALRGASRSVTQLYDLVLSPIGLKATQFIVLKAIYEADEIAQCDFARQHAVAVETLSRRLACLRRKGLIELRIGKHRSERIYALTPAGKALFDKALPFWERAERRLRYSLGEADWKTLLRLSRQICQAAQAAEKLRIDNRLSCK